MARKRLGFTGLAVDPSWQFIVSKPNISSFKLKLIPLIPKYSVKKAIIPVFKVHAKRAKPKLFEKSE
jgi:hypothetical protein